MLHANSAHHLGCCLERLFKKGGHVEIFRGVEDVWHEVLCCLTGSEGSSQLSISAYDGPENISELMDRQ